MRVTLAQKRPYNDNFMMATTLVLNFIKAHDEYSPSLKCFQHAGGFLPMFSQEQKDKYWPFIEDCHLVLHIHISYQVLFEQGFYTYC